MTLTGSENEFISKDNFDKNDPVKPECEGDCYNTNSHPSQKGLNSLENSEPKKKRKYTKKNKSLPKEEKIESPDFLEDGTIVADKDFRIQSNDFMLTYNRAPKKATEDSEEIFAFDESDFYKLKEQLEGYEPLNLSISFEIGNNDNYHLHAYVSRKTDCKASFFNYEGVTPNVKGNLTRGLGRVSSVMCGHYYAGICPKIGSILRYSTLIENDTFVMLQSKWVTKWHTAGKITAENAIAELYKWRNADLYQIRKLESQIVHDNEKRISSAMQTEIELIKSKFKPWRTIPIIEEWKKHYEKLDTRFKFLILVGPTNTGKSEFATALFKNPYEHETEEDWRKYDWATNDAVIFHDVKNIFKIILDKRERFQANTKFHTVQTSETNVYAKRILLYKKPIVICVNRDCLNNYHNQWILGNSVTYELADGEVMWET